MVSTHPFHYTSIILVLIGLGVMIIAIGISLSIKKAVDPASEGKWSIITSLMVVFLLGYTAFLSLQFMHMERYLELIIGIVFFAGALFVFLAMVVIQNTLQQKNNTSRSLENKIIEYKQISEELRQAQASQESIFNSAIPICITSKEFEVIKANRAFYDIFGHAVQTPGSLKCFESHPSADCQSENCPMFRILQGESEVVSDMQKRDILGQDKTFIITARPFLNARKEIIGIVESFQDITERKRAEDAKEELISELQKAFEEVNLLSGLLPICASCKKIRDDKGYWNKIESYISNHSKVQFSHGICPDCAQKLYPELYNEVINNKS